MKVHRKSVKIFLKIVKKSQKIPKNQIHVNLYYSNFFRILVKFLRFFYNFSGNLNVFILT